MHSTLYDHLLPALTWTLIHSLWQGVILTVIGSLVLLLTRRSTASLRYALLCAVFFLFLCGVLVTFLVEYYAENQPGGSGHAAAHLTAPFSDLFYPGRFIEQISIFLNANAQWIFLAWFVVFLFKTGRMMKDVVSIRFIRRHGMLAPGMHWVARAQTLAVELGIRKTIPLVESALVKVPVVIGYFKPLILMPVGMLNHLSPGEVEAILLHELAHIRRHDYLVNFIQQISELLFFFNPGLLWVSSLLRAEREACCDEMAISRTQNKLQFVEALIRCKEHALRTPNYSLGLFGNKNLLKQRLNRIVYNNNRMLSSFEAAFLSLNIVVLVILFPGWSKGVVPADPVASVPHEPGDQLLSSWPIDSYPDLQRQVNKRVRMNTIKKVQAPEDDITLRSSSIPNLAFNIKEENESLAGRKEPETVHFLQQEKVRIQAQKDKAQVNVDRAQAGKDKEQADRDRAQAEKDRQQAEKDREQAEKDRDQAMRDREQADKDRAQAVRDRIQAEQDRILAEKERQSLNLAHHIPPAKAS